MSLLVVITVATAVAVGLVSYGSLQNRLEEEIDRSLVQATNRFLDGPFASRRPGGGNRPRVSIPDRPLGIEQFVYQVTSLEGDIIASTAGATLPVITSMGDPLAQGEPRAADVRTVTSDQGVRYRVRSTGVVLPGGTQFIFQVGRDFSETDNVLADLRTRTLAIGGGVALIAGVLGAVIASGVTSRLRKLSSAAEQIARTGELSVDVPLGGTDETGRLAQSFQGMVRALGKSRFQQQRLVEDAGHELRTPLTSLRTNIEVLRRHDDLPPQVRSQILSDLDQDITELTDLVDEIVAAAAQRRQYSGGDEEMELLDLGDVVTGVIDRFRRRFDREFDVRVDTSKVVARRSSLERAVSNIVDNALKFDAGQGAIEVEVAGGSVIVRDRGPGISESESESIFDRFYRSAEARSMPGSGLGLSIVADAVRDHGGGYFARRRPGGGSEVGFWLPQSAR